MMSSTAKKLLDHGAAIHVEADTAKQSK